MLKFLQFVSGSLQYLFLVVGFVPNINGFANLFQPNLYWVHYFSLPGHQVSYHIPCIFFRSPLRVKNFYHHSLHRGYLVYQSRLSAWPLNSWVPSINWASFRLGCDFHWFFADIQAIFPSFISWTFPTARLAHFPNMKSFIRIYHELYQAKYRAPGRIVLILWWGGHSVERRAPHFLTSSLLLSIFFYSNWWRGTHSIAILHRHWVFMRICW